MKKFLSLLLIATMLLSIAAVAHAELPAYKDLVVGESYTDITASIKMLNHRTDLKDTKIPQYIAEFTAMYPNVTITYDLITDYAQESLTRLTGGDNWGDIIGIPALDKDELPTYFLAYGTEEEIGEIYNFADQNTWDGICYGIPSTGNAQGIVYNKAVFEKAGITELPKTPDEFIAALQKIKDNTDAIPLYTNYAAGWTMGAWDAYIGGSATGDAAFINQKLPHMKDPFSDRGDGTGPYAVYKILYDAAALHLIEDDYTTTDWEGCKGMINQGQIGCMVLGSWAFSQMVEAGPNGDDIGYMSFPITVDGKQYASAGADYSYAINNKSSEENQIAAMLYVKYLTEMSGFAYSEGGIPIDKKGEYPALYAAFDGIEFVPDLPALAGEETLMNDLNSDSELRFNNGGDLKVQQIIENAFYGTKTYDEIMQEWNARWSDAQDYLGVEVNQ
jgi:raffinose/stachyose/melibiose transport system substrate-binding protein